jgi:hypothetical protein
LCSPNHNQFGTTNYAGYLHTTLPPPREFKLVDIVTLNLDRCAGSL